MLRLSNLKRLLSFALALCILATAPASRAADGFWLMATNLHLTGQTNWYYYDGGDSPEGGYMGWLFAGVTNTTGQIPLGRTIAPGTYRVFLKVIDYSGGGRIEVSAGQSRTTLRTDDRDWNRYWTYSLTNLVVAQATSNLTLRLLKSVPTANVQQYLLRGLYLTTNLNENTVIYGEDRIANWSIPTQTNSPNPSFNFVANGSFELPLGQGWGFLAETYEREFTIGALWDTNKAVHGRASIRFPVKGSLTSRLYHLKPNRVYTLSAWARSINPSGFRLQIRSTATAPADFPAALDVYEGFDTTTSWKRYSLSRFLPAYPNSDYQITIVGWPGVSVDAVQLEEGSPTAFRTGNPVEIGFQSDRPGRILFDDESLALSLHAFNTVTESFNGSLVYRIYDIFNREVASGERSLSVPASGRIEEPFSVPNRRGMFRIVAWLKDQPRSMEEITYAVLPRPRIIGTNESSIIGIHPNFVQFQLATLQRLGIKWGRAMSPEAIFRWSLVEPVEGQITWQDAKVNQANQYGMSILGTIGSNDYWPQWANSNGLPNLAKWESFVERLVTHYKGQVKYWEIWNEPIYTFTPQFYAELLKRAAIAIRRADPSAKIVAMGGVHDKNWILQVMTQLGTNWPQSVDIIATHLYPPGTDPSGGEAEDRAIAYKNEVIDRFGVEVWNTETGVWDEGFYKTRNSNFNPVGESIWPHLDSERYVRGSFYEPERMMANFLHCVGNGLTKYFYYDSRIYADPTYLRSHPTILEYDDSIRSKGITYAIAAWYLDGSTGLGSVTSNATTYAYLFGRGGQATVVLWSKDKLNHSLQLPAADWRAFDMMGNEFAVTNASIPFGRTMVYLQAASLSPAAIRSAFQSATVSDRADTVPPNLSLDEFPTGPTSESQISLRWLGIDETSIPSASEPNAVTYSYQLEGRDADWSPWSPATQLTLDSLPVGNYTFRVRARDMATNISTPVSVPIAVKSSLLPAGTENLRKTN